MSFFKKIAHLISQPLHTVADKIPGGNFIVPAALNLIPGVGPAVSAAYTATNAYGHGASLGDSLKQGGLQYAGNAIGTSVGNSLIGDRLGSIGSNLAGANELGPYYGDVGAIAGASAVNANIGGLIGGAAGSEIAKNSFGTPQDTSLASSTSTPFSPTQQDAKEAPASITGLGSLTSDQQSTNLANQGVYGGGNGPQESDYFLNLINRKLVDQSGQTSDIHSLKPIEQSYLQQLGLGGNDNTNSLLEAISKWKAA